LRDRGGVGGKEEGGKKEKKEGRRRDEGGTKEEGPQKGRVSLPCEGCRNNEGEERKEGEKGEEGEEGEQREEVNREANYFKKTLSEFSLKTSPSSKKESFSFLL
jgi:hypothetical protein